MPYMWDSIPAYRLQTATINSFLISLFGYYDFFTTVSDQRWAWGRREAKVDADGLVERS